jgi:hypothetical protein
MCVACDPENALIDAALRLTAIRTAPHNTVAITTTTASTVASVGAVTSN